MKSKDASEYLYTLADVSQLPTLFHGPFLKGHREPRIAMVGRSNVGKSSLINGLLGKSLAQTSKQPGKTRALHFYFWGEGRKILTDLPGYGYARASQEERKKWEQVIAPYFEEDENLERAVLLLDSRLGPTETDLAAMQFLNLKNIPVTVVFTKCDTLKTQSQRALRKKEAHAILERQRIQPTHIFWVSVHQKVGLEELVHGLAI